MARRHKKKRGSNNPPEGGQSSAVKRPPERLGTALSPLLKAMLKKQEDEKQALAKRAETVRAAEQQAQEQARERAQQESKRHRATPPSFMSLSPSRHTSPQLSQPDERLPAVPSARELRLLNEAYEGVVPLSQSERRSMRRAHGRAPYRAPLPDSSLPSADQMARKRLNALVGEGVRFDMHVDADGWAEAIRHGVPRRELRRLRSPSFHAEDSLDLHGMTVSQVDGAVNSFVRKHHRQGCRYLLIVHGKGLHSADQCGVLGEAVLQSLTRGGAAPLVRALSHAHERRGGRGALAIALM